MEGLDRKGALQRGVQLIWFRATTPRGLCTEKFSSALQGGQLYHKGNGKHVVNSEGISLGAFLQKILLFALGQGLGWEMKNIQQIAWRDLNTTTTTRHTATSTTLFLVTTALNSYNCKPIGNTQGFMLAECKSCTFWRHCRNTRFALELTQLDYDDRSITHTTVTPDHQNQLS